MKRSTIAVIAILLALAIGVAVLAILNGKNAEAKQRLRSDAAFMIIIGEVEHKVTMEEFRALDLREIQANYKKNGKAPEIRAYTGIPFAEILRQRNIDLADITKVIFTAADNYASAITMEEALNEDNCFIVLDDEAGPFRMILARDQFSQRWCGYLTDVDLK